jgi:acetyltransferase-like isoleucine patch superfamily enzyme
MYGILSRLVKKIMAFYYKYRNTRGARYVDGSAQVLGWRNVRIGRNSVVSEGVWINVTHRREDGIQIEIQDNCFIGRRNTLSSGRIIRIGSYCLTGMDCKFIGSDHIYSDPFSPYVSTGATKECAIDVGVNCWFGANVIIIGQSRIGYGSIIGANTLIVGDVPAFSLVVGTPGRVVKRYDIETRKWIEISVYSAEMEAKLPTESAYLERLRAGYPSIQLPVHSAGKYWGDLP